MAIPAQEIRIRPAQCARQLLVPHRTSVHEQELRHSRAPTIGRQRGETGHGDALPLRIDLDRIGTEITAQNGFHTGRRFTPFRRIDHAPLTPARHIAQRNGDGWGREAQPLDHLGNRLQFGAIGTQKLQSGRRGVKQVAHLDHRAAAQGAGNRIGQGATVDRDLPRLRPRHTAGQPQPRNRPDGGQRLTAKPE